MMLYFASTPIAHNEMLKIAHNILEALEIVKTHHMYKCLLTTKRGTVMTFDHQWRLWTTWLGTG